MIWKSKKRHPLDQVYDVLTVSMDGLTATDLSTSTTVQYYKIKLFLKELVRLGLLNEETKPVQIDKTRWGNLIVIVPHKKHEDRRVSKDGLKHIYATTPKGTQFIKLYNKIASLVAPDVKEVEE